MNTEQLAAAIESIKIANLQPDDVLIFRVQSIMSDETAARIRRAIEDLVPGIKVIVLDNGADIEVLRKIK